MLLPPCQDVYDHLGSTSGVQPHATALAVPVQYAVSCAAMEGQLRLQDGQSGPGYEYGRLEVFRRGFWGDVSGKNSFTPESAQVACMNLGFDGGTVLRFTVPYTTSVEPVMTADTLHHA